MGRQHTVRQASRHSRQYTAPQPNASSNQDLANQRHQSPLKSNLPLRHKLSWLLFAARLLQHNTWLLWLLALSILVGSTTAAVTTLLNPNASIPYSSGLTVASSPPAPTKPLRETHIAPLTRPASPIAAADSESSSPLRQQQSKQPSVSPQSAVGAIALSCAAGCFLLSQWLKPKRTSKRHVLFESRSSSKQIQASNTSAVVAPVTLADTPRFPQPPQISAVPTISFDLKPTEPQPDEAPVIEIVEVTVLPNEQSHPLDWDEPSLADSLDLRQRRPLSYWL